MRNSRLFLAFLFAASGAFGEIPLPADNEQWLTVTSGEFRIFSSSSERATVEMVTELLRMRETIGKVTQLKVRSSLPMYIFVFKNERTFAPFRDALFQRRNANVSGGFLSTENANFVILQNDARGGVDRVVYHELTHYFVENTMAGLPLWFNEGIAEYYSTFSTSGDRVQIGKIVPEHLRWLRNGNLLPLAQLFAVDSRSPDYSEGRRQGVFYAESWALIHYILAGNEQRRPQLPEFLAAIRSGKSNEEAFQSAFRTTFASLEGELRAYVRQPVMSFTSYPIGELHVPEVMPPQAAPRDVVLVALGNLLAQSNAASAGDAVRFLEEATRLNPKNAEAHASLGFVHERNNDRAAATAAYEQAIALGSSDAQVYISYGATILERANANLRAGGGATSAEDVSRARQLFEKAVGLDASAARGWAGVGATYVIGDGDLTTGIAALEKSLALAASQEDVAFHLMQLYGLAGRRADAQRVFESNLARSSDPELVQQGREALVMADVATAEALLDTGKVTEGLALMRTLVSTTTNVRLKAQLENAIAVEEENLRRREQIELVNGAIASAHAGKYAEALKVLDEVLPRITDPTVKEYVEKVRADLARMTRPR